MPYIRRIMRPRWPPSPSVEDEFVSLSRELHGLSYLGSKPGIEGVCARGTIDQSPVLLDLDISPPSFVYSTGNTSSDDSNGPLTPPPNARKEPLSESMGDASYKPSRPQTTRQHMHPPSKQDPRKPARRSTGSPRPQSHQPRLNSQGTGVPKLHELPATSKPASTTKPTRNVARSLPASSSQIPSLRRSHTTVTPVPKRPGSTSGRPKERSTSSQHRSDYPSHFTTTKPKPIHPLAQEKKVFPKQPTGAMNIVRNLEEQVAHDEQRDSTSFLVPEDQNSQEIPLASPIINPGNIPLPTSPNANEKLAVAQATPTPQSSSRESRSRATSVSSDAASFSTAPLPASHPELPRSMSSNEVHPIASPTKRAVSFGAAQEITVDPHKAVVHKRPFSAVPSRRNSPSLEVARPASPRASNLCLLPCPRSVPMAGRQDWSTIKGMEHLNICPSCMKQVESSRFRQYLIPSIPHLRGQQVHCSFSEPWIRLAWLQTVKKRLKDFKMLMDISRPPPGGFCPGRAISYQHWYQVFDTEMGTYLPRFNACSACIRNLKILMPSLRETFAQSTVKQEWICDFETDSPRFVQYVDLLDAAANRAGSKGSSPPDISDFLDYAYRKGTFRDCRLDRQVVSTWHFIPQLPELTVCEDCYDDVISPLARAKKPIARMFSSTLRLLPGQDGATRCREASCQLYSPRMRTKFREAVLKNDFGMLEFIALNRFEAEQQYLDRREELMDDEELGYDCDLDFRVNLEEWRKWE